MTEGGEAEFSLFCCRCDREFKTNQIRRLCATCLREVDRLVGTQKREAESRGQ